MKKKMIILVIAELFVFEAASLIPIVWKKHGSLMTEMIICQTLLTSQPKYGL